MGKKLQAVEGFFLQNGVSQRVSIAVLIGEYYWTNFACGGETEPSEKIVQVIQTEFECEYACDT